MRLDEVVEPFLDRASPIYEALAGWEEVLRRTTLFEPVAVRAFPYPHRVARADLPATVATTSDVATLPEPSRAQLLDAVREFASDFEDPVVFAMTTTVHLYRRRS
jgi:hypothetical protein